MARVPQRLASFNPRADRPAALVDFLVALPVCLGSALGSGAPLVTGIIAGVVGCVVVRMLSRSPLSVSGPVAGLTTVFASALQELGTLEAFLAAVVPAGALQVVLGLLRPGVVGHDVPDTVFNGMMAAIGLILVLKQIPHLVGYDADYFGDDGFQQTGAENTFSAVLHAFGTLSPGATVVGLVSRLWFQGAERAGYGLIALGSASRRS